MATNKQLDEEALLDEMKEVNDITNNYQREVIEQAYRNAYADGFKGCMSIVQEWARQGPKSEKGLWLAYDLLDAYYQTRLHMWRIGGVDKEIIPPDFFTKSS